jgi:hypothetical protein
MASGFVIQLVTGCVEIYYLDSSKELGCVHVKNGAPREDVGTIQLQPDQAERQWWMCKACIKQYEYK